MESIAERIKVIRKNYKMNQKKFSEQIGISQASLSDIEKGKTRPSIDLVILLSKQYGVSTDWILTGDSRSEVINNDFVIMNSLFNKFFNNLADFISILDVNEKELLNRFCNLGENEKKEILNDLEGQLSEKNQNLTAN